MEYSQPINRDNKGIIKAVTSGPSTEMVPLKGTGQGGMDGSLEPRYGGAGGEPGGGAGGGKKGGTMLGWKQAWLDFSHSTTLHGVNKVTEASSFNIRRLLWLMIILLGLSLFIKQMIQSVEYYLLRPVTVNVKINYNKTLTFPAVTLCNQNDFRTTATASRGMYQLVQQYYANVKDSGIDLARYNASNVTLDLLYQQMAHRKEDMIVKCEWDEQECSQDDFMEIFTDYGRCFTFNLGLNQSKPLRVVQRTGADRGLRLLINIEQYEYMLGPNPGAGVKILIHENTEVPSVRDLGHAIPPGTHAYVGIQITKVTNLKPPHGKCNDSVQLKYFEHYSVPACIQECKADYLDQHCGCRDFYMIEKDIFDNPAPPVCTLQQNQDCTIPLLAEEFYKPLPHGHERCDCPIACTRLLYDPTISYAQTSKYDTMIFKRSNKTEQLYPKFIDARETFQRVDDLELRTNYWLITNLNYSITAIDQILSDVVDEVRQVTKTLTSSQQTIAKRTRFHRRWGVAKVKYIVHHDFARGWDVIDERTLSLVTVGYKELVAYLRHVIDLVNITSPNETQTLRMLSTLADQTLYPKEVLCERTKDNLTVIREGFLESTPILTYLASPGRRYDLTWVSPSIIQVQPRAKEYMDKLSLRTEQYCEQVGALRSIMAEIALNGSVDEEEFEKVAFKFEKAARSFNYYRFTFHDKVVMATEAAADKVIERFANANTSVVEKYEGVRRDVQGFLNFLDTLRKSWTFMVDLNKETSRYLRQETNKSSLAHLLFSDNVTEAKNSLRNYFSEARLRSHDLMDTLDQYQTSLEKLWRIMLEEEALKNFYQHVHDDVVEAESNSTALELLLHAFSYMSATSKNFVRENVSQMRLLMNADFPETSFADKVVDIDAEFGELRARVDITANLKGLDEDFLGRIRELDHNLQTFIDGNRVDDNFFENNFLSVDVFMKELSYEEIEQQVAYDLTSLWSDIGGSMGLFIGASVITGFEIIDVIIVNFIRLHCTRSRRRKHPT